uniref:Collagen protein n=1 Tax=Suberites domuncula TaxID=55567 RepID=Q9GV99_SUBDO|nr:collagen protein [Suberites domuncula]
MVHTDQGRQENQQESQQENQQDHQQDHQQAAYNLNCDQDNRARNDQSVGQYKIWLITLSIAVAILTALVIATIGLVCYVLISQQTEQLQQEISQLQGRLDTHLTNEITSTTYTRWGSNVCPSNATLVYNGITGRSHDKDNDNDNDNENGGGSNYQCMPMGNNVQYNSETTTSTYGGSIMSATEYRTSLRSGGHDVPCAVCFVTSRSTVLMIPARYECLDSTWTKEYDGYLMTSPSGHYRSTYECVDRSLDVIDGTMGTGTYRAYFYHVQTVCSSDYGLPCLPYQSSILQCVVCTK